MPAVVVVRQLGLVPYAAGLAAQAAAADEVRRGALDGVLLALRHPPVITMGRRTRPGDVHVPRWERRALGIDLFHADRGGGATFHYPAQAVVYAILHLGRLRLTVGSLLDAVAGALDAVLCAHGVAGGSWDAARPGYYVAGAKVASVGLHLAGDLTTHGVALNVGPGAMAGFLLIDACREPGLPVACMADAIGRAPDADAVALALASAIAARVGAPPT